MTRQAHDIERFTKFSLWLRDIGRQWPSHYSSRVISLQNLDYIWHNYRENWIILIEEKRHGGMINHRAEFAQNDTHTIVDQMLHYGSCKPVTNARGNTIMVEHRGYYKVIFENETPDDGGISINGNLATKRDLFYLLKHGTLPPHLKDN